MHKHHVYRILAVALLWTANAPADIVWSGSMYQRIYHDVPAIDFNLDGTNDFTFNLEVVTIVGVSYYYSIEPANGQIVVEKISDTLRGGGYPLTAGTVISASLGVPGPVEVVWNASEASLFVYSMPDVGEFGFGGFFVDNQSYLGVSFDLEGSTHYGWVELSHNADKIWPSADDPYLYIHGWAWETDADTPITAGVIPEPSTGILTMVGSLGLLLHARSRRRAKQPRLPRLPTASTPPGAW